MALLCLVTTLILPSPASACTCAFPGTPQEEFIESDAVFIGKMISYGRGTVLRDFLRRNVPILNPTLSYERTYIFTVTKSWKGIEENSVTITSDGVSCGYPFIPEMEFIVYADQSGSDLFASMCSRTKTTDPQLASEDLAFLNTLSPLPLNASYSATISSILCGVIFSSTSLFLFLYIRQKRKKSITI